MYKIAATRAFQDDMDRLDRTIASFVLQKVEWVAEHPEMARYQLKHLPDDLKGLHKYRIGDHRIFFWMDHDKQQMVLYRVLHRREAYRELGE